ncbi:MAG: prefoldin subunit alpha [Candidatus Asgardarchaeia archaeon]
MSKKPRVSPEAKVNELLYLLQVYEAQLKTLENQLSLINLRLQELKAAKEFLTSLSSLDLNTELLFPIGGGVFIRGKVIDKENVLMDIGANVVVKRGLNESSETVNNDIMDLENTKKQIEQQTMQLLNKYEELRRLLEQYLGRK